MPNNVLRSTSLRRITAPGSGESAGANARASTDFPVPDNPPTATSFACTGCQKFLRKGRIFPCLFYQFRVVSFLPVSCGVDFGADRRADRHEERERGECVQIMDATGFRQIAIEHDVGGRMKPPVDQVHQEKGEIVEDVAGGDAVVEFDVRRKRPARRR